MPHLRNDWLTKESEISLGKIFYVSLVHYAIAENEILLKSFKKEEFPEVQKK